MQPWGLIKKSQQEFGTAFFNPYLEFAMLVEDITPNNIHTGERQIQRPRIDHMQEKIRETKPHRKAKR